MSLSSGGPSVGGVGGSGGGSHGHGGGGPSSSSFTPFTKKYTRVYTQSYKKATATATASSSSISSNDDDGGGDAFTSVMRDRQERGKDPYHSGDGSDGSDLSDRESGATPSKLRLVGGGRPEKEDFARTELRQKAIAFLDNPELLMMYAQSTGDSIPGARLHFMRILCGYDEISQHSSSSKASASTSRFANRPDHPRQHSHNSHNLGEKRRR